MLPASGPCALRTANGPVPLKIQTASLRVVDTTVDLTMGRTTEDARCATWRFSGALGQNDQGDRCGRLLDAAADLP